jgi:hypothetical protein
MMGFAQCVQAVLQKTAARYGAAAAAAAVAAAAARRSDCSSRRMQET